MKSNIFTAIRFVLALLTLVALISKPHIPPRTLLIHPVPETLTGLYGNHSEHWLDQDKHDWRCDYKLEYGYQTCGISLSWTPPPAACAQNSESLTCTDEAGDDLGFDHDDNCGATGAAPCAPNTAEINTVDFSKYDQLKASVHYEGRATFIRFTLQNNDPALHDQLPGKHMSAYTRTENLRTGPVYLDLREFAVEEWWVMEHNPPRHLAQPGFKHIRAVTIDYLDHGMHRMRVDRVELVGERLTMETLLKVLIAVWAIYLLIEATIRYYRLYRDSRQREVEIRDLTTLAQDLEQEKHSLQERYVTDALTGVFNRAGLAQKLSEQAKKGLPAGVGMMILDIDRFKALNDAYGHELGDRVLTDLAKIVASCIREDDLFARWGGEEFILMTPPQHEDTLISMGEKLRSIIEEHEFSSDLPLKITVSIGITKAHNHENFDSVFKRADAALYEAKHKRNHVVFIDQPG